MKNRIYILLLVLILFSTSCGNSSVYNTYDNTPFPLPPGIISFSFAVTADMQEYTGTNINYFP